MNVKLLTLFFILYTSAQVLASSATYSLSPRNFDEVFDSIVSKHQAEFELDNQGIGVAPVRDYLRGLLNGYLTDNFVEPPSMCVVEDLKDELRINVTGEFETYHFSYLKFNDGTSQATEYSTTDFDVPLENGWQFSLLTIYGTSEDTRSGLYIIIIDKDLARCNSFCRGSERIIPRSNDNPNHGVDITLHSFPNPTPDQTQLTFQLESTQKISLQLVQPSTGKIMIQKLDNQYFPQGDYQYTFDIQLLPAGLYFIILRTEYQQQSIPIIKID